MINQNMRRVLGIGLAASLLAGATTVLGQRALAQETKSPAAQEGAQQGQPRRPRQPGQPGQAGGGEFQGGPGGGGFGGPGGGFGGPGGPGGGFGPPPGMMGGGGATMTATATAVYILRGNQLLAYDARTLSLIKSVELPRPQMGPGGEGPRGFGGPGGPGGRPQRPGGEN